MNIFGRMQIRTACMLPDAHHIQQLMLSPDTNQWQSL